jgi:hypothetical protein
MIHAACLPAGSLHRPASRTGLECLSSGGHPITFISIQEFAGRLSDMYLPEEAGLLPLAGRAVLAARDVLAAREVAASGADMNNAKEAIGSYWDVRHPCSRRLSGLTRCHQNVKIFAYALIGLGSLLLIENLVLLCCCIRNKRKKREQDAKDKEELGVRKFMARQAMDDARPREKERYMPGPPPVEKPKPKRLPPSWLQRAPSADDIKSTRAKSRPSSVVSIPGALPFRQRASDAPPPQGFSQRAPRYEDPGPALTRPTYAPQQGSQYVQEPEAHHGDSPSNWDTPTPSDDAKPQANAPQYDRYPNPRD